MSKLYLHTLLVFILPTALACTAIAEEQTVKDRKQQSYEKLTALFTGGREMIRVIVGLKGAPELTTSLPMLPISGQARKKAISSRQKRLLDELPLPATRKITRFRKIPYMMLKVNRDELRALLDHPLVSSLQEDALETPNYNPSYNISIIGADAAWDLGYTGAGQVVVIMDTGVDSTHPALVDKVVAEACFSSNDLDTGISSLCPDRTEEQIGPGAGINCDMAIFNCAHGTRMAGITAGNNNEIKGVAKDANIISIQVYSQVNDAATCNPRPVPCLKTYISDHIRAFEYIEGLTDTYAIAAINMSFGHGRNTGICNGDSRKDMVDRLRNAGIATISISGNDGYSDAIQQPACISSVISTGATDNLDSIPDFSNSAFFLDLLAPGVNIYSSVPGGRYEERSGTSSAAPHVASAWAILKEAKPDATVDEILGALVNSGIPITDRKNGITRPRIQVNQALNILPGDHYCDSHSGDLICQIITHIMEVNWGAAEDLIIAANRGWWGYANGLPPENSLAAMNAAASFLPEINLLKVDVALTSDGEPVAFHDHVMGRLTGQAGRPSDYSLNQMTAMFLIDRNGVTSTDTVATFGEILAIAQSQNKLVIVDINDQGLGEAAWLNAAGAVADEADGLEQYIVFKIPYDHTHIASQFGENMTHFLYIPTLEASQFGDIQAVCDYIDIWHSNYGSNVLAFETNFRNNSDILLAPFSRNNFDYDNILHYIKATTGKRSGVFSLSPDSRMGVANRDGTWTMPNMAIDFRGNPVELMAADAHHDQHTEDLAKFMMITTDRPDVWLDIKNAW